MPLSWSAFGVAKWETYVQKIADRIFTNEQEYMSWLGQGARVFEEEANNMVAICEGMLEIIVKNLLR